MFLHNGGALCFHLPDFKTLSSAAEQTHGA